MAKTATTTTTEPPKQSPVEKAATVGVTALAGNIAKFRNAPPPITSKRATHSIFSGVQAMVDELRTEAIGKASNGRVDVDAACDAANLALGKAVKSFDTKGVPDPFDKLVDADTLQRMAVPVLRVALTAWNNHLPAPQKKQETL